MSTKRFVIGTLVVVMVLTMVLGIAFAKPKGTPDDAERLYKFKIIGLKNPKNVNMYQGHGKVIFVNLDGPSKINLVCSDDPEVLADYPELVEGSFDILDKDATDSDPKDPNSGAILALPDPNLDPYLVGEKGDADVWSAYSIYIRSFGKPDGWATITTCADLVDSDFAGLLSGKYLSVLNREGYFGGWASVEQVGQAITERPKGKSIFTNVTAQLLTIVFKVQVELDDGSVIVEYVRVPIFDDIIENEYWEYDNKGLKFLQVCNETVVSDADDPGSW